MADSRLSVFEISRLQQARQLSAKECIARAFEQTKRWSDLGALISLNEAAASALAHECDVERIAGRLRGVLHGIPFLAKDNIDTVTMPTSGGTPALKRRVPRKNAAVIDALQSQGAILIGKTNMHELAFGVTSNNAAFGPARNPYDLRKIPGGSSGGTAAAVAAGFAPFGLGSDTGGSVRLPAALCGLVGFRPTTGRYSGIGVVPISSTRDTVGPMACTVGEVALIDAVLATQAPPLPHRHLKGLRLGVPRAYFYEDLESEVASVTEALLRTLAQSGVQLVEADIDRIAELDEAVSFVVVNYEAHRQLEDYLEHDGSGISVNDVIEQIASPDVRNAYLALSKRDVVSEDAYRRAVSEARPALRSQIERYLDTHLLDAYIVPSASMTARPIGDDETVELNGKRVPTFRSYIRNADPSSNAGIPSISIPVGHTSARLPIGMMIEGRAGHDRELLAIAAAIEQVTSRLAEPRRDPQK